MDLNHLVSFLAVCQHQNISKAAKQLRISQPALSQQIKALETAIGSPLVVRKSHGITLTVEGSRLEEAITPAMNTLSERLGLIKKQRAARSGLIRIGSISEFGKSYLLPRVRSFLQKFPDVKIDISFSSGDEIVAKLQNHLLDFGIIASMPEINTINVRQIHLEKSVLVTRASNPRSVESVGDVLASEFVAFRANDPLLNLFLKQFTVSSLSQKVKAKLCVNDHASMIDVLLEFDLYAVMPIHCLQGPLHTGALRVASSIEVHSPILMARNEKPNDTFILKAFLEWIAR